MAKIYMFNYAFDLCLFVTPGGNSVTSTQPNLWAGDGSFMPFYTLLLGLKTNITKCEV